MIDEEESITRCLRRLPSLQLMYDLFMFQPSFV